MNEEQEKRYSQEHKTLAQRHEEEMKLLFADEGDKAYTDIREFGTRTTIDQKKAHRFMPHHYVISAGCNVFHYDDIVKILIREKVGYELVYQYIEGRDRFWQLRVGDEYINIIASGYGTGDSLVFTEGFDDELMFCILCRLAISHSRDMMSYHNRNHRYDDDWVSHISMHRAFMDSVEEVHSINELLLLTDFVTARRRIPSLKRLSELDDSHPFSRGGAEWKKELSRVEKEYLELKDTRIAQAFLQHEVDYQEDLSEEQADFEEKYAYLQSLDDPSGFFAFVRSKEPYTIRWYIKDLRDEKEEWE